MTIQNLSITFITFFTLKTLAQLYLNWRNLKHIQKNANEVPAQFQEDISIEDHQKAATYSVVKIKFEQFSMIFHSLLFLAWFPFGGLNWLNDFVLSFKEASITQGLILYCSFFLITYFISLPEKVYNTFWIEEKFGFNNTTPGIFIKDQFKQLLLLGIIGLPILATVLYIIESAGQNWWLVAFFVVMGFQFFLMWAYPTFISPLFNKFTPLEEGELKERVNTLLEKCQFQSDGLFVMDASIRSSHGNAYFTGLGKKKRIVFFDTLLKTLEPQEVEAVLAHELGHFKKKHILKALVRATVFSFIGFYILGALFNNDIFLKGHFIQTHNPAIVLLIFSIVSGIYTFFLTPLSSWLSRKNEYEADAFAAEYSEAKDLISSLIKLYRDNASTLTPDPVYTDFYHSHPPALKRIAHLNELSSS